MIIDFIIQKIVYLRLFCQFWQNLASRWGTRKILNENICEIETWTSKPAWMHLRCIFVTSHATSQTPQRGLICKCGRVSRETDKRSLLRDFSDISQVFSDTSLRWIWDSILGLQANGFFGYLFIYLRVLKYFAELM